MIDRMYSQQKYWPHALFLCLFGKKPIRSLKKHWRKEGLKKSTFLLHGACRLFFVKKPSSGLHLVTDFTGLNKRVLRPTHPFPSSNDIISGLDPNSKVFANLDFLSSYHQIELSDEASYLTTFLLPSSMYRYMRAPMGLSSSSDEFCRRLDAVMAGIDGVRKLVDDILIEGVDMNDLEKKVDDRAKLLRWACLHSVRKEIWNRHLRQIRGIH